MLSDKVNGEHAYNPVTLTDDELIMLHDIIRSGSTQIFYTWRKWRKEREHVLRQDKHECQHCKRAGRYTKATMVHHIKHLRTHPQYALMMWVQVDGTWQRQLISLCEACHEREHPERLRKYERKEPLTPERW